MLPTTRQIVLLFGIQAWMYDWDFGRCTSRHWNQLPRSTEIHQQRHTITGAQTGLKIGSKPLFYMAPALLPYPKYFLTNQWFHRDQQHLVKTAQPLPTWSHGPWQFQEPTDHRPPTESPPSSSEHICYRCDPNKVHHHTKSSSYSHPGKTSPG